MKKLAVFILLFFSVNFSNAQWFVNGANNSYWDSSNMYFDKSTYNENNPYKDWKIPKKKNDMKYNVEGFNYKNYQNKYNYIIILPFLNQNLIFR